MEDHWSCLLLYEAFPITNKFADLLFLPLIPTAQLFTTTKMRHSRAGNGINQSNITPNCRSVWHVNQKVNSSDTKQFFLVTIYDTYQGVPWRRVCLEEAFRVPTALSPIGTCKLERFSFDPKKWFPWVFPLVLSAKRSRNHFLAAKESLDERDVVRLWKRKPNSLRPRCGKLLFWNLIFSREAFLCPPI